MKNQLKSQDAGNMVSKLFYMIDNISDYIFRNIYHDPEILLDYTLEKVIKLMHGKAGNIRLFDKDSKTLVLKASYGISKNYRKMKSVLDIGTSVAGYVFKKGKMYIAEDLRKNHLYQFPEYTLKEGIMSIISVPLISSKQKLGTLSVYFPLPKKFKQEEIEFFSILSKIISNFFIIHNLQYKLQRSFLNLSKALIVALEEKDLYTKGHSERVQEYAVKIAKRMNLSKSKIQIIEDFSILHDIGKIYIDSSILNKPDKLTEEEWEIIKRHPVVGAKMISFMDELTSSLPIVKYHHERIDGKGYPGGITKIPLLARIISVADAFDAMTSQRAYKDAINVEKAKDELVKNIGRQFDEKVVGAMVKLIEEGSITLGDNFKI